MAVLPCRENGESLLYPLCDTLLFNDLLNFEMLSKFPLSFMGTLATMDTVADRVECALERMCV